MSATSSIAFTRGVPPAEAFPVEDLADCAAGAVRNDPSVVLQYGKSSGYLPLRKWLAEQHGLDVEQVFVGNGSLQLMDLVCGLLLAPGDAAFVESPSYDRAILTLRRHRANVVGIPLAPDGVNLEALEAAVATHRPKLFYIIGDFQNPSGVTTVAAKRRHIAALAEKHGFWIIEDVPYRRLRYYGEEEPTFLSLAPGRVLQMSSFSKLLSPGMRTGYLLGPAEVVGRLAKVAEDTYITPVLPTQGIVYEYCRRGLLEPNIARLRDLYRPKLEATLAALAAELPGAEWATPEGGYFVGVTLPAGIDTPTLLAKAGEAGLVLTNGDGFFVEPPSRAFVRIPFCSLSPDEVAAGVARLGKIVREHA